MRLSYLDSSWKYLLLILLLAAGLRLVNLSGRALWYDEAFAVLFAEKGLDAMLDGTLTEVEGGAADIHPLLYYTTLDIWMEIFGQSPFAVRLWSVMLGLLTVGVVYVLSRELFDEKTGFTAALITAIAPFHVQYSQETRMYSLLGLLLMLTTYSFLKAWRSQKWIWWVAFGVLAGLAMYTQQLAAFYLITLGLVPFVAKRRGQIYRVVVGAVVAIVVYLPWLINLPSQFNKVRSYYWIAKPNPARFLLTTRSFLVVNLDMPASVSTPAFLGALFMMLFVIVQVFIFARSRRTPRPQLRIVLFVVWLAGMPPLLMWLVSQFQPVYLERGLIASALMLYILLAWLFTRSGVPRPILTVIGVVALLLVGVGLFYQYTWDQFPNSPFQDAGDFVRANWQAGDVVVHQNKISALPMIYYGRDLTQHYIGDTPGAAEDTLALPTQEALQLLADSCVQAAVGDGQRVWFVTFGFAEEQYASAGRPEFTQAVTWLQANFTEMQTYTFNDLTVQLFERDEDVHAESVDCAV